MGPKEKAEELVDKYNDLLQKEMTCIVYVQSAKDCALVAVEEIKNNYPPTSKVIGKQFTEYWEQVKKEIEKL